MAVANLHNTGVNIDTGKESIVIRQDLGDIPGGKTLDVTGITASVIEAGHIILLETATGQYKPNGVSAGAYVALPLGHVYAGVLKASVLTAKPFASIMVRGTVNEVASPYPVLAAAKTELKHIIFTQD